MTVGDYQTACASFAESHRLDAATGTVMNLAACEEKLGLLASSWEHWQHALRSLPRSDRRRPFVEERIAALEKDLPKLTIVVKTATPERVELERDGVPLGRVSWGISMPVDPGAHEVIVRSPDHRSRTYQVEVSKGEVKTLEVTTGLELPKSGPKRKNGRSGRALAYVAGGIGLAGLGTAVATGIMLRGTKDTVAEHCPAKQCDAVGMSAVRRGRTQLALNTTGFVVAGIGLGTGATLLLLTSNTNGQDQDEPSKSGKVTTRADFHVLPGGAALTYAGVF